MQDADAKRFFPGAVDYDGRVSTSYSASRALSAETANTWCALLEPFLQPARPLTLLDLGCGTGRFAAVFARRFAVRVIGLDPSRGMLKVAANGNVHTNLTYVAGAAEAVPLRSGSCDIAWLSHVIHHVSDPPACAEELRRVVRRDGRVLIRGTFGDRTDGFPTLFHFFPGARDIAREFPSFGLIEDCFEQAGFAVESLRRVEQPICASLAELAARTALRADSTLALLPDSEFERCQRDLECAAQREIEPTPVVEKIDFLVLGAAA